MKQQLTRPCSQNAVCPNCKQSFIAKHYSKGKYQKYCSISCNVKAQHKAGLIGFEKHNPNYIDGRSTKVNYCLCGRQTKDYRNKLCQRCYLKKLIKQNKESHHKRRVPEPKYDADNHWWKGDDVGYTGIHIWLNKKFGKANKCENSNCDKSSTHFEYALIKGKKHKRRRNHYIMLCRKCHRNYDFGNIEL